MMKNCAYDQIYHEHLLYYSLYSFQGLLEQFGLEMFDASLDNYSRGIMRCICCKEGYL